MNKKSYKKNLSIPETQQSVEKEFENQTRIKKFILWFYFKFFKNHSVARQLLLWYAFFTFLGGFLLWTPFALQEGIEILFIDALFTAASAVSTTGLTTVIVSDTFSFFGQLIIMIWIIIGGIGWFAIKIYFINWLFFKKYRYTTFQQANERFGTSGTDVTKGIIKTSVLTTIVVIIVFGTAAGIALATVPAFPPDVSGMPGVDPNNLDPNLYGNWTESMWSGYFLVASAINNAGFDNFSGGYSMMAYYGNYGIQTIVMLLFVLGGTGFTAIYDIKEWIKNKSTGQRFRLSVATKVSLIAYWSIALTGIGITFLAEGLDSIQEASTAFLSADNGFGPTSNRVFALFFNTTSTRNAGFSTVDINSFTETTLFTYSIMMFIGSGPGSTAGGIRTTTFAILILSLWSHMRGKQEVVISQRRISSEQIKEASMILLFSLSFIATSILFISMSEFDNSSMSFFNIIFISSSAFGTTGMATVELIDLQVFTKVWIFLMMFIGQLGAGTTMRQFRSSKLEKQKAYHVEEKINF